MLKLIHKTSVNIHDSLFKYFIFVFAIWYSFLADICTTIMQQRNILKYDCRLYVSVSAVTI